MPLFYREAPIFTETFEHLQGWSSTLPNELIFPNPSFSTINFTETFEAGSGWSGT